MGVLLLLSSVAWAMVDSVAWVRVGRGASNTTVGPLRLYTGACEILSLSLPLACLFVYAKSHGEARETCIQKIGTPSRANIRRDDSSAVHTGRSRGSRCLDQSAGRGDFAFRSHPASC